MAIRRQRPAPGLIQHSDRGIQYATDEYRQALAAAAITPSMSRKGNCLDNAPMESFFHTLKVERVHHRVYATDDPTLCPALQRPTPAICADGPNTHRRTQGLALKEAGALQEGPIQSHGM
jgi:hypothetical protein